MAKSHSEQRNYVDSLRLSAQDQQALLTRLARQKKDASSSERRVAERMAFTEQAGLVVQMRHPGGTTVNYLVRARNLSSTGIAFLHGSFVHMGTQCVIVLQTIDHRIQGVEGKVVRCQHVSGHVHDVGVRFNRRVRVREFVPAVVLVDDSTRVSAVLPHLSGQVLYVADSASDQDLLRFHLDSMGLDLRLAGQGMAAVEMAAKGGFQLVLVEAALPGMTGEQVIAALREMGHAGPIVLLTADDREPTRQRALAAGATQVLVKPYTPEDLIALLARHLSSQRRPLDPDEPLVSKLWGNHRMRAVISTYVRRLEGQIQQLQRLVREGGSPATVHKLCLDIKGLAGGYGYPQISQTALELYKLSLQEEPGDRLAGEVARLADYCRAALLGLAEERNASGPDSGPQRRGA